MWRTHTQSGSGDGAGTGAGCRPVDEHRIGTGAGTETRTVAGMETRTGSGGRRSGEKRKKPNMSCRRDAVNGGDLGGKRKKRRQERASSVVADPDNLDNCKGGGREAQGTRG